MALRSRHCRITAGLASMDMPLLVSSVESQLWEFCSWLYRASWLAQGYIPLLRLLPYFLRSEAEFLRVLCFEFRAKSSRWGHPPSGRGLSQISIGTKTFWRTFSGGWWLAFAMGSPISGRVALFCALDRNDGFFHSSILSCFAMGSPCESSVWFPTLDRNEASFG